MNNGAEYKTLRDAVSAVAKLCLNISHNVLAALVGMLCYSRSHELFLQSLHLLQYDWWDNRVIVNHQTNSKTQSFMY